MRSLLLRLHKQHDWIQPWVFTGHTLSSNPGTVTLTVSQAEASKASDSEPAYRLKGYNVSAPIRSETRSSLPEQRRSHPGSCRCSDTKIIEVIFFARGLEALHAFFVARLLADAQALEYTLMLGTAETANRLCQTSSHQLETRMLP